jgi:hypothetical protein
MSETGARLPMVFDPRMHGSEFVQLIFFCNRIKYRGRKHTKIETVKFGSRPPKKDSCELTETGA